MLDLVNSVAIFDILTTFKTTRVIKLPFLLAIWFLHQIVRLCGTITNSVAILVCFVYLKHFRDQTSIIVDGYVGLLRIFAEYVPAVLCFCHGVLDTDVFYTTLGLVGVLGGLGVRFLQVYHHEQRRRFKKTKIHLPTCFANAAYIGWTYVCCCALHHLFASVGVLPCLTRILTSVVPLVALSDTFRNSGSFVGNSFSKAADVLAVATLWWNCGHLSIKYFVVVPSVVGLLFAFIRHVLGEIDKGRLEKDVVDLLN